MTKSEQAELSLKAARVMGIEATIDHGVPFVLQQDPYQAFDPLTDWRDTGRCLEWLTEHHGVVSLRKDDHGASVTVSWSLYHDPDLYIEGDTRKEAIVRAVVAMGGEHDD